MTETDGIYMIVGLGNPGRAYARSRHNVGYEVARRFSERHSICLRRKRKLRSLTGVGEAGGRKVVAVIPTTFMNRSGEAVARAVGFYGVHPKDALVILDDVNLPLGQLRIRSKGSDGGHKGLRSVIVYLGTMDFPRLRIGIGRPARVGDQDPTPQGRPLSLSAGGSVLGAVDDSQPLTSFVLGDFTREEKAVIEEALERAAEATDMILVEGLASAMNEYNRDCDAGGDNDQEMKERLGNENTGRTDRGLC